MCCLPTTTDIYIFDSHIHGERGASIFSTKLENLEEFLLHVITVKQNELIYTCEITVY